jgi:hypothetical protein
LALSLWHQQALYSEHEERYGNWWGVLLDARTQKSIENAIAGFRSYPEFMAAYRRDQRPNAVQFDMGPGRARFDEMRERLPQVSFEEFVALLDKPVVNRKQYAEAFGKRVTAVLKEFLEVPAHRPKVKLSKADLADDLWLRRLAAYILNFPENCS